MMQIHQEIMRQLRIPVTGMDKFEPVKNSYLNTGVFDEIKSTKFYRDKGQLHRRHIVTPPTMRVCFIQREDGYLKVAQVDSDHEILLRLLLDAEVNAEVIECRIPAEDWVCYTTYPLWFILQHHPKLQARKKAFLMMCDILGLEGATYKCEPEYQLQH